MVIRKKRTRSEKVRISEEDRISQLPNALICDILSHLSTKDAVKTSVLSTKWRNLWQSVPVLDLRSSIGKFNEFVSFVNRFIDSQRESCIHKILLTIDYRQSLDAMLLLSPWIDAVTTRKIQHIDIRNNSIFGYHVIPLSLYTCKTLVHLKLYRATLVNAEVISLPCLKIIHLEEMKYHNEATLEKLIAGSPLLEDLTLIRSTDNAKLLQVCSQTLKRIHINEFIKVVIDAPLLQCLKTKVHNTKNFKIINSDFSGKLDIAVSFNFNVFEDHLSKSSVIRDIHTDISRVRDLDISSNTWKVIIHYSKPGPLLQFSYLSRLNATFFYSDIEILPTLLESFPNLESLVLNLDEKPSVIGYRKKRKPKVMFSTVPPCLVTSLKFVEFERSISGCESEMKLVKYFLQNSKILEKMTVRLLNCYYRVKAKYVIFTELLAMPRCSSACEFVVLSKE